MGYDPRCLAPEDWCQAMRVDSLPLGRTQPFYHVNLLLAAAAALSCALPLLGSWSKAPEPQAPCLFAFPPAPPPQVLVDVRDRPGGQTTYVAQARGGPCGLSVLGRSTQRSPPGARLTSPPLLPSLGLQENIVSVRAPRPVRHPLVDQLFVRFEPEAAPGHYIAGPQLRSAFPHEF